MSKTTLPPCFLARRIAFLLMASRFGLEKCVPDTRTALADAMKASSMSSSVSPASAQFSR